MTRNLFSKLIALTAGIILLIVAYNHNQKSLYEISGTAYGTRWSITSTEYISDLHKNNIISIINRIDYVASNYKKDSEIALINFSQKNNFKISNDLLNILTIAKDVEGSSNGFYNIMMAKVSSQLGFSPRFNNTLDQTNISSYNIDTQNLILSRDSSNWFDLSSIAKGYAVQCIHNYLKENNMNNHLIDIGGEIIINGKNIDDNWKVGIQDPSYMNNKALKIITNDNSSFLAIATSGEYRNFKIGDNGNKVSHTINPKTLRSVNNKILSVTVLHESSATYADAYATAFNAMGYKQAFVKSNELNVASMFVLNNDEIVYSNKWYDLVR
ncbi:FAD:protein FMN transferase [Gammaproteobacteria bacterium]|nr:FAD:protein FMN transferase [Gammaproteobacteria bacterium]